MMETKTKITRLAAAERYIAAWEAVEHGVCDWDLHHEQIDELQRASDEWAVLNDRPRRWPIPTDERPIALEFNIPTPWPTSGPIRLDVSDQDFNAVLRTIHRRIMAVPYPRRENPLLTLARAIENLIVETGGWPDAVQQPEGDAGLDEASLDQTRENLARGVQ